MSEFQIMTGVPAPDNLRHRKALYPFDKMEVGQSFFVPGQTKRSMSQNCRTWSKKLNATFVCDDYSVTDEQGTVTVGTMVWRVAN